MEDLKLIAFCGFKGSGKSTASRYMEKYGFKTRALAAPLKEACQTIFKLSDEQVYTGEGKETYDPRWEMTPRRILQQFGTEVGRSFSESVWIKSLQYHIEESGHNKWTIDDLRFPNEAAAVRNMGGVVVGVRRDEATPELTWKDLLPKWVADLFKIDQLHASERQMALMWEDMVDITISNNGSLNELYDKLYHIQQAVVEGAI